MLLLIALNGVPAKRHASSPWLTKNSSTSSSLNSIAKLCQKIRALRWMKRWEHTILIKQLMIRKRSSSAGTMLKMDVLRGRNVLKWNSYILLANWYGTQKVITLQQWPTTYRPPVKFWFIVYPGAILLDPSPKLKVLFNPSVSIQPGQTSSLVHISKCSSTTCRSRLS